MPYKDPERAREYERQRSRGRHRKDRRQRPGRSMPPEYMAMWRAAHPDYYKEYRARFPERERARQKMSRERRAGRVVKLDCEVCGTSAKVEAHHAFGYSPEMACAVWWLCKRHHEAMHSAIHWAATPQ